jgi:hypothetical protein
MFIAMLHVQSMYPCNMPMLCPCSMSMLHIRAACQ